MELLNIVEKLFENYNISKLDIKRIYRYLDKNVKKEDPKKAAAKKTAAKKKAAPKNKAAAAE